MRTDPPIGPGAADAGDLLPLGGDEPGTEPVHARAYLHPHLPGRPVVVLTGATEAQVRDRVLGALGFTRPEAPGRPVARRRTGGAGYPEWALRHDPDRAERALAAAPAMARAARLAGSRPGTAASAYAGIAARLPPAHLPAFWEQAGRHFIQARQPAHAGLMFARAREAEQAHRLPVDEAARRAAYLEFSLAGALPAKAVTAYAADLAARYHPGRAREELLALAVRRTLGGLPPWADLPRQLRTLARAAGLDAQAEERRALASLLAMPSVRCAAPAFWEGYRPRLVRLARRSPELRLTLLHLFPYADIDEWWLDLLGEAGALGDLERDPDPGAWLTRMAAHLKRGRRARPAPTPLLELVARLRPGPHPVRLGEGESWRARYLDADLLDACLAAGLPVEDPAPGLAVDLYEWLRTRRRDLAAAAADPRYAPLLHAAVGVHAAERGVEDLLPVPALRPFVREWIAAESAAAARGGLADAKEAVARLERLAGGAALSVLPGTREAIRGIDLTLPLRRTLAAGVLDELGWDALDDAADELGPDAEITASWPVLTLYTRTRAIAVGPEGRVAEHDLALPPPAQSHTVIYSAGAFLVVWHDGHGRRGYWSTEPDAVRTVAGRGWSVYPNAGHGFAFLAEDGARVTGRTLLRPGDMRVEDTPRLLCEGGAYWAQPEVWRAELRELDPRTGDLGPPAAPPFLAAAALPEGHEWAVEACTLAPLPEGVRESPLGTDGARLGARVSTDGHGGYRVESVDGRAAALRIERGLAPWGLLALPGAGAPMVVAGESIVWLLDPADGAGHWQAAIGPNEHWTPSTAGLARGTPIVPPPAFWHFLRPRDPAASAALRRIARPQVRRLLAAAVADLSEDAKRPDLPLLDAALTSLATHPRLRRGLSGVIRQAAELHMRLTHLTTPA
ncbi:hypothetical protein HNP84_001577 [Thermocatellispora tengchongensis]|uniref:DNA-binding protein n=1 Tax=Thermocatellispora tengchongensis TaxID=1073253 RepID=A0A840NT33_9ACTN|nr:hypothetical protein [Thermocatellispora tengchongensis]MBB5131864.1 hypothetical protein [Thermocatellispora tengchongensis]